MSLPEDCFPGSFKSISDFAENISLAYFCRSVQETLAGPKVVEEDKFIAALADRIIMVLVEKRKQISVVDDETALKRISERIEEAIDFLVSIHCINRDVDSAGATIAWVGIMGISQSVKVLTEEEEDMEKDGTIEEIESLSRKCKEIEDAIEKEKNYEGLLKRVCERSTETLYPQERIVAASDTQQGILSNASTMTSEIVAGEKDTDSQVVPFMIIATDTQADLVCEVTPNNHQVFLESTKPLNLYSDCDILNALAHTTAKHEI